MGLGRSKPIKLKFLLLGLDGAGKTTLLYKLRLKTANVEFESTQGFNYEVCNQKFNQRSYRLDIWDLAGHRQLRKIWRYFYDNMEVDIMGFVVSAKAEEKHRLREASQIFTRLSFESSLKYTNRVIILNSFATREQEKTYETTPEEVRHHFGSDATVIMMNAKNPGMGLRRLFQWISEQSLASTRRIAADKALKKQEKAAAKARR